MGQQRQRRYWLLACCDSVLLQVQEAPLQACPQTTL